MTENRTEGPGSHGEKDIDVRFIAKFAIGFVLFAVAVQVSLWFVYKGLRSRARSKDAPAITMVTPEEESKAYARLQDGVSRATPRDEVREWKQVEQDRLDAFGWVDRDREIVSIPVVRAMRLVAEEGLPHRDPVKGAPEMGSMTRNMEHGEDETGSTSEPIEHSGVEEH